MTDALDGLPAASHNACLEFGDRADPDPIGR